MDKDPIFKKCKYLIGLKCNIIKSGFNFSSIKRFNSNKN